MTGKLITIGVTNNQILNQISYFIILFRSIS